MKNISCSLLLGIGLGLVMFGASCSTQSRIRHYQGDGEIKANPDYGLVGGGGGYTLKFKPIELNHPAHITYHFSGLPRWEAEIFFAIESSQKWEWRDYYEWHQKHYPDEQDNKIAVIDDLKATLAMSLRDTQGKLVFEFKKKLRELTWSGTDLYDEGTVDFIPDGREYILEVTIIPDPTLKEDLGYVLIRGGGHEPISIGF